MSKRRKRKNKQPSEKSPLHGSSNQTKRKQPTRRGFLAWSRNWGVLCAAATVGGWYLISEVAATIAEHDLSRIGNGIPAVVQIHDPRCSLCVALQKEAREAMKEFGEEELQYLVANITNPDGRTLAAAYGVGNVTLLLFDGEGKRRRILSGSNTSDILKHYFRSHRDHYRAGH